MAYVRQTAIEHCSFLVDYAPVHYAGTQLEPNYIDDEATWQKMMCRPFLDTDRTGLIGRLIWLPDLPIVPAKFRRHWGHYCLLRRRTSQPA